jgi:hypothetical protein
MAEASGVSCKEELDPTMDETFSKILLNKIENSSSANNIASVTPPFNKSTGASSGSKESIRG